MIPYHKFYCTLCRGDDHGQYVQAWSIEDAAMTFADDQYDEEPFKSLVVYVTGQLGDVHEITVGVYTEPSFVADKVTNLRQLADDIQDRDDQELADAKAKP